MTLKRTGVLLFYGVREFLPGILCAVFSTLWPVSSVASNSKWRDWLGWIWKDEPGKTDPWRLAGGTGRKCLQSGGYSQGSY